MELAEKMSFLSHVVGTAHASIEAKKAIRYYILKGMALRLEADPDNAFGKETVKVFFNEHQIGWMPTDHRYKKQVFSTLIAGLTVEASVIESKERHIYNDNSKHCGTELYVEASITTPKQEDLGERLWKVSNVWI